MQEAARQHAETGKPARQLYEDLYCERGEMENRIKEQLSLFAGRVSTETLRANQLRLRLLKIGAQTRITVRKAWLSMASSFPLQRLFGQVCQNPRPVVVCGEHGPKTSSGEPETDSLRSV